MRDFRRTEFADVAREYILVMKAIYSSFRTPVGDSIIKPTAYQYSLVVFMKELEPLYSLYPDMWPLEKGANL
jgi:hypothetical protein